tara:strand:- start:1848 stop:3026 length:1179 start_codon:yes stop_codon:yes gene_type:complete
MIGLGSPLNRPGKIGKRIVKDNLVLQHNYNKGYVEQVSTGAAFFNGGSNYIQLPSAFSNASNKITVSAWVYNTGSGTEAIFENRNASVGATRGILFYVDSNQALKVKCQDVAIGGTNGLSLNKWVHACFTYDSNAGGTDELKLYENGVLVATGNVDIDFDNTAWSNARLGRGNVTDYYYPGYMCNVGIWDEVLTPAEIKSIWYKNYADLTTAEKTNLVSWYNLDSTDIYVDTDVTECVLDLNTSFGSNLYQYDNGDITGIVARGNNTIESDAGAVKVTFVDDDDGARWKFSNPATLTSNLTDDSIYQLKVTAKINTGVANLRLVLADAGDVDGPSFTIGTIDHTYYKEYTAYFKASHATKNRFDMENMDGVEVIWVKDVSVRLVTGNTGTLL